MRGGREKKPAAKRPPQGVEPVRGRFFAAKLFDRVDSHEVMQEEPDGLVSGHVHLDQMYRDELLQQILRIAHVHIENRSSDPRREINGAKHAKRPEKASR